MAIRHILLIRFRGSASAADIEQVRRLFDAIPDKVPGVRSVEWGLNNSPENKNRGYTHCVFMTFVDEAGREAYLPHPEHDRLRAVFSPLLDDIVVFDYEVEH